MKKEKQRIDAPELSHKTALEILDRLSEGKSFRSIAREIGIKRRWMEQWYVNDSRFKAAVDQVRPTVMTPLHYERPTPEMERHGGVLWEVADRDGKGNPTAMRAKRNDSCKLDWYFNKEIISAEMRQAGYKFTYLHFTAGKQPRVTPMYGDFVSGRRGQDAFMGKTDAQIKLEDAIAVLTPGEADVLWDVCGNDQYAGKPQRVRDMQTGLRALMLHFAIRR